VIAVDTAVMRGSCLTVFTVYLLHCIMSLFLFLLTVHVYSYIQLLVASVFIKFSVPVHGFVLVGQKL